MSSRASYCLLSSEEEVSGAEESDMDRNGGSIGNGVSSKKIEKYTAFQKLRYEAVQRKLEVVESMELADLSSHNKSCIVSSIGAGVWRALHRFVHWSRCVACE